MTTFEQLKKNSSKLSQDLQAKLKQAKNKEKKSYGEDDRFWTAKQDAAGNASAVIRFLPSQDTPEPYVKYFWHGFDHEDNKKFFIHNCPTTKGKECPVCNSNKELWKAGGDANEALARTRKRKQSIISNILVVNDPANPENNGKVFLFKFGVKIFDKMLEALCPEDETDEPLDIYNIFEGHNFKLKVKKVAGWTNFDSSVFDQKATPICDGNEAEMKKVFEQIYPLDPFINDAAFKSFEELEKAFAITVGSKVSSTTSIEDTTDETNEQLEELIKSKMTQKSSNLLDDDIPTFESKESVPFDVDSDEDIDAQLKALIDE